MNLVEYTGYTSRNLNCIQPACIYVLVLCHGAPAHHSAVEKLRWILKPADVPSGRGDQKISKGGGIQHATTGLMTAAGPMKIQEYASSGLKLPLPIKIHLASTNLIHQQFGRICLVEIVHRWSTQTAGDC